MKQNNHDQKRKREANALNKWGATAAIAIVLVITFALKFLMTGEVTDSDLWPMMQLAIYLILMSFFARHNR